MLYMLHMLFIYIVLSNICIRIKLFQVTVIGYLRRLLFGFNHASAILGARLKDVIHVKFRQPQLPFGKPL